MRARDHRRNGRIALKGNWFKAIITTFIAWMLGGVAGSGFSVTFSVPVPDGATPDNVQSAAAPISTGSMEGLVYFLIGLGAALVISLIISLVVGSAVSIGYAHFNLDMADGNKPRIYTLFAHFNQFAPAIGARILVFIRVFIGLCLGIIPGIIAAYKYAMIYHVLADNPNMRAKEVLRESARIMKGYKWKYFCLMLSFIGWNFLAVLTVIGVYFVIPYEQATMASFYRYAKSHSVA